MSQSYSSASSTPIPAGKETGESVAGTTTKFTLKNWGTFRLSIYWPALKRIFLWNLVEDIFAIYLPIIVIAHAVLYYTRYREREVRTAQLQAQLSDAKLLALKSQLQPHFLFNTLHSISSLMLRDVHAAD